MDLGIADAQQTITIYNDNQAAVNWAVAFTTKGTKHINLHKNCVHEAHHSRIVKITHIPGVVNESDLFTKELKDAAHFHCCRDLMMVSRQNFLKHHHCVPSHLTTRDHLPYYSLHSPHTPNAFKHTVTSGHSLPPQSGIPQGSAQGYTSQPRDPTCSAVSYTSVTNNPHSRTCPPTAPTTTESDLIHLLLTQQAETQRQHAAIVSTFMAELRYLATASVPAPTAIKPLTFPTYKKDSPLDIFLAQVSTFKQNKFFDGCDWDSKAPDLQHLFTNDALYDNDGFLMLSQLILHVQPVSHQNKFLTMLEFANLTKHNNETKATLFSHAKGINNILTGINISECMPLKILPCLGDSYPGLIACYTQGNPVFVNATLLELEQLMATEWEAHKAFPTLDPLVSANRAVHRHAISEAPSSTSPGSTGYTPPQSEGATYPLLKGAPWPTVEDVISKAEICPCCHSHSRWHINDGAYCCIPLARQGLVITNDQPTADVILADYLAFQLQNQHCGNRTQSRGRRCSRGGRGACANHTSMPPTLPPVPDPAPAPATACRATSCSPLDSHFPSDHIIAPDVSLPQDTGNPYAVLDQEMDSDSGDDAAYDQTLL
ncbi:hypothetical protein ACHAWX_002187 [Stephanocyclus meneghinianus]